MVCKETVEWNDSNINDPASNESTKQATDTAFLTTETANDTAKNENLNVLPEDTSIKPTEKMKDFTRTFADPQDDFETKILMR